MKTMKTLTLAGQTYEIVDEVARRVNTTLTESGVAADAKTVGDKIAEIKENLNSIKDVFYITVDFNNPVPGDGNVFKITESAEEVLAAYNSGKMLYAIISSSDEEVLLLPHVAMMEGGLLFGLQLETTAMAAIYPLGQEYIILEQAELTAEMFGGATPDDITNAIKAIDFPVDSVNGKKGDVVLTAEDVGAATESDITNAINAIDFPVDSVNGRTGAVQLSAGDVGAVPTTRTVNGKSLNTNITLNAADVGAATEDYVDNQLSALVDSAPGTLDTLNELAAALGDDPNFATTVSNNIASKVPLTRKINNKSLNADITLTADDVGAAPATREVNGKPLTSDITLNAGDVGAVPTGRTINGKSLINNITLTAADVGALPADTDVTDTFIISTTNIVGADEDGMGMLFNIDKTVAEIATALTQKKSIIFIVSGSEILYLPLLMLEDTTLVFGAQAGPSVITVVLDMTNAQAHLRIEEMSAESFGAATQNDITNAIAAIDFPVDSVNGKTGAVTLTAEDVGALPEDTKINDFFFIGAEIASVTEDGKYICRMSSTIEEIMDALDNSKFPIVGFSMGAAGVIIPWRGINGDTGMPIFELTSGSDKIEAEITNDSLIIIAMSRLSAENIDNLVTHGDITNAINAIDFPVDSVNGKTGAVTLNASDVGALPSSTVIPKVDSSLSTTSTNAIQNKAVATALNAKLGATETAVAADKLATPRTISLTGDVTGSGTFDGSGDLSITATVANSSHNHSASNITSGTLDAARLPNISIDKLVAGTTNTTIPASLLPSYVDDVLEYSAKANFPTTGETGKIYVDTATNKTYRWSGSAYVEISASLALGTTSSTAFRGDYGDRAYQHANARGISVASGLYKITTNDQGHVTAVTGVSKSDITGLGIPGQDTTYSAATTSSAGLMSANDKKKLDAMGEGAGANQNAFSYVKVGTTDIAANNETATLTLAADSGVTLTPDATNDKVTFAHADTSSVANVIANGRKYVTGLTFDGFGHVTGVTTGTETVTNTNTTYDLAASTSSANGNVKLNLTAGGSGSGTDSVTIKGSGATTVTTDANGIITISSTDTDTNTDTKVTSAANHYTPAADTSALLSVDASSSTAATWNSTSLVTGVNLQRDAKGHVTGVTVDSIKMPANPNSDTNTTYDLTSSKSSTNGNVQINLVAGGSGSGTDSVTIKGAGSTTVTTDANGVISVTGATIPTTLKNPNVLKFGSKTYDGSAEKEITAADLGLSSAMKFLGTSATAITDGATTNPITIGSTSTTVTAGNVVLYGSKEFVWNSSKWEELGNEGSYKVVQDAVSSPSASGNATAFIDTISQDTNGKITVTKKNVQFPTAPSLSGGSAAANDATVAGGVTVSGHAVTVPKKTIKGGSNVTVTGGTSEITISATDTTYGAATQSAAGLMSAADKKKLDGIASGATANTGDITGVTAGNGLTGGGTSGSVTLNVGAGTGITVAADTVSAKLRSTTALTVDSAAATTTSGRVYPVAPDKSGYLAVNVPWTDTDTKYTLPNATSSTLGGVKIGSNISISKGTISVPTASGTSAGVTIVYPAASCTTFSSDSGTVTPLAVQKGAKMFATTVAVPRISSTDKAIARFDGTDGDLQDSKIIIEDVTNTRDTSKKAQVIAIPAEGNKKMVYGYCTDQVDGTSFIGGVFDKDATAYPYNAGLAIGGTSGNLLWKGSKVISASDLAAGSTAGIVKTTSTVTSTSGLTACPIISGVPYYKDTDTKYTLPNATSSTLGGVKIGNNINVSSGTISLTKTNVTTALGYTPPTTNTTYSAATSSALGLVKIGSNISNSSGTISLTKANVTSALGYTPPTKDTNTTYSLSTGTRTTTTYEVFLEDSNGSGTGANLASATTSKAGLMSAADKTKLDSINTSYIGSHATLLWTNSSPTSAFGSTSSNTQVPMPVNTNTFDFIAIRYLFGNMEGSEDGIRTQIAKSGDIMAMDGALGAKKTVASRGAQIYVTNISFKPGYYNGTANTKAIIPLEVYGITLPVAASS